MTDEKFEFMQDCRDKKITARSAKNKRTHNGKGGRVRFPSDYLTKKEREAMNGECKSYRMNESMNYQDFKALPDDLKEVYLNSIIKKYNVPISAISKAMGMDSSTLSWLIKNRKLKVDVKPKGGRSNWDQVGFYNWWNGIKIAEQIPVEESSESKENENDELIAINEQPELVIQEEVRITPNDEAEAMYEAFKKSIAECKPVAVPTNIYEGAYNYMPVIPKNGTMTFEHNNADDALATIKALLSNIKVNITVSWESVT